MSLSNHHFFKAKLIRRDPRMVERKKTGLAKARKRVRFKWYKVLEILHIPCSTHGSSGSLLRIIIYIMCAAFTYNINNPLHLFCEIND